MAPTGSQLLRTRWCQPYRDANDANRNTDDGKIIYFPTGCKSGTSSATFPVHSSRALRWGLKLRNLSQKSALIRLSLVLVHFTPLPGSPVFCGSPTPSPSSRLLSFFLRHLTLLLRRLVWPHRLHTRLCLHDASYMTQSTAT